MQVQFFANDQPAGSITLRRPGTFLFEAMLPPAPEYRLGIRVDPTIRIPNDDRPYGVNFSLIRLAPAWP